MAAWVQAEKYIQIALVLPCGALIGWLLGAWLAHALHQPWMEMAGIVLGIAGGLSGAIRMAVSLTGGQSANGDAADDDAGAGAGNQSDKGGHRRSS